jgi:4-hydroxythreonine-4-phosphate dehydrogenase
MSFLAITSGDPCGIGPEVILKTLAKRSTPRDVQIGVIGDRRVFTEASRRLRLRLPAWVVFLDCAHRTRFKPGCSSAAAGRASLAYLERAIALWKAGQLGALVTAPVTKWAIARSQPLFVGQTEYLARSCGVRDVVMLFVSDALRVALLTRHVPLRRVAQAIDRRLLRTSIRLTDQALRMQFGIRRPRLAVCGINPHAGEESSRSEERRLIVPVLRALRRGGLRCDGPFAADGFFAQPHAYDAVVCAYHDQGLIPFKMVARDLGCQVSVGLPMVRTSPDHGSALDIAGRGVADPGSMRYALELATRLVKRAC